MQARAFAFKQLGEKPPPSGSSGGAKGGSGSCGGGSGGAGAGAAGGDDGGFYKGTDVVTLTDDNFDEEVIQSDDIWMVEVRSAVLIGAKADRIWVAGKHGL